MVILAELNNNNVCVGVKIVKAIINDGKHIEIPVFDSDYYLWRKYENGQWSEEKYLPPLPIEFKIAADKTEITADGQDKAVITATIPDGINTAYVLVNGPPIQELPVVDNQVQFEVTAEPEEVGLHKVEIAAGQHQGYVIVEAVSA